MKTFKKHLQAICREAQEAQICDMDVTPEQYEQLETITGMALDLADAEDLASFLKEKF